MQIDSTIMLMGAIVKIHWVFSFLVWSPSSLAKQARLGRRLNEYQGQAQRQLFRCGFASTTKLRVLAALCKTVRDIMKINEKSMSLIRSKMEAFCKFQKLDFFNDLESLKRTGAAQGSLQSGNTIKKGCEILSSYLESRESYLLKTIKDMPLKLDKNLCDDLKSISEKYIPVDFNDFRGNYLKLLSMAAGQRMQSYNAGLELADVTNGKVMERCNLEIDQFCHAFKSNRAPETQWLIALEIVAFTVTIFLSGLWATNPEGNYEPWIVIIGTVTAGMEIVRRLRFRDA